MKNEVAHFQLLDGRARAVVVISTGITRSAVQKHGLDPLAAIALGRSMACVAALASTLKHSQQSASTQVVPSALEMISGTMENSAPLDYLI